MDLRAFRSALEQLEAERGIPKNKIIETIELALAAAYKKDYGKKGQIIRAEFNPETGKTKFSQIKIVVDESMLKPEEEAPTLAGSEVGVPTSDTEGRASGKKLRKKLKRKKKTKKNREKCALTRNGTLCSKKPTK